MIREKLGGGVRSEATLPPGWTQVPLESLAVEGSVTYGVVQPGQCVSGGVPMVRVNNFRAFGLDTSDVLSIATDVEAKYTRTRLRADDVLITVVGTVGQIAVVPPSLAGWNVARAVAVIRPREAKLARWIALALRSPESQRALGVAANTTVQTTINLKDLRKLPVPVPESKERQAIEVLLGSLDDRIDLLRQTNATLEAIAQALFKSWFINFDPVRAKAEGREPEGMDAATAALFPAEFEESALGLIPKGWQVGCFGDLATLAKGSVKPLDFPTMTFEHYSLPAFDAGELPVLEAGGSIKSNKTRIPRGAVLQSKLNPHIPRVWYTADVGDQAICSTEFLPWVSRKTASPELLYSTLRASAFEAQVRTLVTGTSNSHQRVKADQIATLNIVSAPTAVRSAFTDVVRPLLKQVAANRVRTSTLAELRDTLLPRLISGKLRLPEAEAVVAEAAPA